jgi:hypothetical protein
MNRIACMFVLAGAAASTLPGVALAGSPGAPTTVSGIFGKTYSATRWSLAGDLGTTSTNANRAVVIEGMAIYNGQLWIHGDDDPGQFESRILRYDNINSPVAGAVSNFSQPNVVAINGSIGSEGITINRGTTGYGAFTGNAPTIIALEGSAPNLRRGLINTATTTASLTTTALPASIEGDDIAWLPSTGGFAVLQKQNGGSTPRGVALYDSSFNQIANSYFRTENIDLDPGASTFVIPRGGRALTAISHTFAAGLLGLTQLAAGDYLIIPSDRFVSGDAANSRCMVIMGLDGKFIGSTIVQFPSAIGDVQGFTVDESTNTLFFGDQVNFAVWAVQVPTPGAAALLGLAGLTAARRRRA